MSYGTTGPQWVNTGQVGANKYLKYNAEKLQIHEKLHELDELWFVKKVRYIRMSVFIHNIFYQGQFQPLVIVIACVCLSVCVSITTRENTLATRENT